MLKLKRRGIFHTTLNHQICKLVFKNSYMIIIELALQTENCDIDLSKDSSLPKILPFADLIVRVSFDCPCQFYITPVEIQKCNQVCNQLLVLKLLV